LDVGDLLSKIWIFFYEILRLEGKREYSKRKEKTRTVRFLKADEVWQSDRHFVDRQAGSSFAKP